MSRRRVLIAAGAAVGGGVLSMSQAAAADSRTLTVAEFAIESESPHFELSLTDDVADVLPADQTYSVLEDGVQIGELSPEKREMSVPSGTSGPMSVLTEADMSTWQRLKSTIFGGQDDERTFELSLSERASELDEGDTVMVTDDAAVITAIGEAGDDTTLELGGESIPHEDESGGDGRGYYAVEGDALVYVAGTDPPDSTRITAQTGIGTFGEIKDDISRRRS